MTPSPSPSNLDPGAPVIEVENLGKRFGDVVALGGIDLQVAPGSVFGLLGPNGAGKTTAVRILTTILLPDQGRASVMGIDVTADPQAVRERIGLAGQYAAVDENLTGRENLRMMGRLTHLPKRTVRRRADELLERFDLASAGDRTVRTFSGGMRRRLDLAAALVDRPPVLFLDEPTTGLDPRSRSDLWGVIEELVADGTSVLLTTQYLEEADRLADRIAVIDGGKKIAEGTAAELKATLGTTIIEVGLSTADDAERARAALDPLGTTEVEGLVLALSADEGATSVLAAARHLDDAGLVPQSFAVREPTLDDVFLTLTGHHTATHEAADDGADRADPGAGPGDAPPPVSYPLLEPQVERR